MSLPVKGEHLWGSSGAQDWWWSFCLTSCPVSSFCQPAPPLTSFWFWVHFSQHPLLAFPLFPTSYFMSLWPCLFLSFFSHFRISQSLWPAVCRECIESPRKRAERTQQPSYLEPAFTSNLFFSFETAARADTSGFGKGADPSRPV